MEWPFFALGAVFGACLCALAFLWWMLREEE